MPPNPPPFYQHTADAHRSRRGNGLVCAFNNNSVLCIIGSGRVKAQVSLHDLAFSRFFPKILLWLKSLK